MIWLPHLSPYAISSAHGDKPKTVLALGTFPHLLHLFPMVSIKTEITINAPPQTVRSTFLDFESHAKWNPFFVRVKDVGEVNPGTGLEIDMKLKGETTVRTMKPVVLVNSEDELKWKGNLGFDSVFVGAHYFKFESIEDGAATRLVQGEDFGGFLVPVLNLVGLFEKTKASFEDLNEALKKEAESRA